MKRAFVDACGGFVIHRWDPTGARLPSYVRPDKAICTWHGRQSVTIAGGKERCGVCGRELSKYTQASKRATKRSGKLIDIHPLLRGRLLESDEPLFFCLEGCLKADAVASTGRLAISVPSITMWKADAEPLHWELWLPLVKQHKPVFVIPDSDYQPKPGWDGYNPGAHPRYAKGGEVRYSTDRCVHWLRRCHGIDASFLVPPYLTRLQALELNVKLKDRHKIGIDDHIATGGNFDRWDANANPRGVHTWVFERSSYRNLPQIAYDNQKRRDRDNKFLDWLEEFAGYEGFYSPTDLCRDLNWSSRTAWKAKLACIKRGVLEVDHGNPLGEGNGNEPNYYRFAIRETQPGGLPSKEAVLPKV
jgi:hypothetical protein